MLTTSSSSAVYLGDGATTLFPFNFFVQQATHLVVSITNNNVSPSVVSPLATSQYSVTGIGDPTGGLITYPLSGSPLPAGWSITIGRIVPYQQNTSLTNQGAFYPQVVEAALDYLTMQVQQLANQLTNYVAPPYQQVTGPILFGDPTLDGSWRIIPSGDNLSFDHREVGVWVSKGTFNP
jgi:hypothetical protein